MNLSGLVVWKQPLPKRFWDFHLPLRWSIMTCPRSPWGVIGSSHLGPASSFQSTAAAYPYNRAMFWGQGSRRGWQPPSSWQWPGLGPRHPPSHPRLCPHQSSHPCCAAGKQRGGAEHLLGRGIHSFPSCPKPWACFPHRRLCLTPWSSGNPSCNDWLDTCSVSWDLGEPHSHCLGTTLAMCFDQNKNETV